MPWNPRTTSPAVLLVGTFLLTGCKASLRSAAAAETRGNDSAAAPYAAWQGNWGEFHKPAGSKFHAGAALIVRNCTQTGCDYQLMVTGPDINGGGNGKLQVLSPTEADLRMDMTFGGKVCALHALRSTAPDRIQLQPAPGDCSAFVTPGTILVQTLLLHSRTPVVDPDVVGCYLATDPARLAVCTSKQLSADQSAWEKQADQTDTLQHPHDHGELDRIDRAKSSILQACESAQNVASCLHTGFTQSGKALAGQHAASIAALLAPGNPATGRAEAARIAGSYKSHFANSDVDGDHYRSTDTLKITLRADGAIDYDTHLEFFNGHECNLNGTATFARNGMFVDPEKQDSDTAPLCTFQIAPGKHGVTFHDPNGACRELNCGMRGSFEGSTFAFKDRVGGRRR